MEDSKVNEIDSVINPRPRPVGMAVRVGSVVDVGRLIVADMTPNNRVLGVSLLTPITRVLAILVKV